MISSLNLKHGLNTFLIGLYCEVHIGPLTKKKSCILIIIWLNGCNLIIFIHFVSQSNIYDTWHFDWVPTSTQFITNVDFDGWKWLSCYHLIKLKDQHASFFF